MSILVGDNFSYSASKPLDARLKYSTIAEMKAVADATMYDGCMAYCSESDKTYQWKSTNTVDETLGRWREFSSGGGSTGGGHTIEDSEGTDLTQRETLQFGEGFKAEDDDTNEKTVISPDVMQSGDMDDVITPLPSVAPKKEGIKYSTTEQVIGEWIDGKPLYQRVITGTTGATAGSSATIVSIPNISDIDSIVKVKYMLLYNGAENPTYVIEGNYYENNTYNICYWIGDGVIKDIASSAYTNKPVIVILNYTKVSDTPNT